MQVQEPDASKDTLVHRVARAHVNIYLHMLNVVDFVPDGGNWLHKGLSGTHDVHSSQCYDRVALEKLTLSELSAVAGFP